MEFNEQCTLDYISKSLEYLTVVLAELHKWSNVKFVT